MPPGGRCPPGGIFYYKGETTNPAITVLRPLYREAFSCRKHENPEAASAIWGRMLHITKTLADRCFVTVHRSLYREAFSCWKHENPEAASAIWGRMLHICASRSVLLDTECTVTRCFLERETAQHIGGNNFEGMIK